MMHKLILVAEVLTGKAIVISKKGDKLQLYPNGMRRDVVVNSLASVLKSLSKV